MYLYDVSEHKPLHSANELFSPPTNQHSVAVTLTTQLSVAVMLTNQHSIAVALTSQHSVAVMLASSYPKPIHCYVLFEF